MKPLIRPLLLLLAFLLVPAIASALQGSGSTGTVPPRAQAHRLFAPVAP